MSGKSQIKDALNELSAKEGDKGYLVMCCNDGEEALEVIEELIPEERLILSSNAINFI